MGALVAVSSYQVFLRDTLSGMVYQIQLDSKKCSRHSYSFYSERALEELLADTFLEALGIRESLPLVVRKVSQVGSSLDIYFETSNVPLLRAVSAKYSPMPEAGVSRVLKDSENTGDQEHAYFLRRFFP